MKTKYVLEANVNFKVTVEADDEVKANLAAQATLNNLDFDLDSFRSSYTDSSDVVMSDLFIGQAKFKVKSKKEVK